MCTPDIGRDLVNQGGVLGDGLPFHDRNVGDGHGGVQTVLVTVHKQLVGGTGRYSLHVIVTVVVGHGEEIRPQKHHRRLPQWYWIQASQIDQQLTCRRTFHGDGAFEVAGTGGGTTRDQGDIELENFTLRDLHIFFHRGSVPGKNIGHRIGAGVNTQDVVVTVRGGDGEPFVSQFLNLDHGSHGGITALDRYHPFQPGGLQRHGGHSGQFTGDDLDTLQSDVLVTYVTVQITEGHGIRPCRNPVDDPVALIVGDGHELGAGNGDQYSLVIAALGTHDHPADRSSLVRIHHQHHRR